MEKAESESTCFSCGVLYLEEDTETWRLMVVCGRDGHETDNWSSCRNWRPIRTETMQLTIF